MAHKNNEDATIIKKYANRRLYNTGTSTYVTLDDLSEMVKRKEVFTVQDAKTGDDLTHAVLTQIVFELENKNGETLLPISVLRQLIGFYGDQMQTLLPSYLEHSMGAFAKEQEKMREQMGTMFDPNAMNKALKGGNPIELIEAQTRRNMDMFTNAMRLMTPFGPMAGGAEDDAQPVAPKSSEKASETEANAHGGDLGQLRDQIAEMQRKIDKLGS